MTGSANSGWRAVVALVSHRLAAFSAWQGRDGDSAPAVWLERQIILMRWVGIALAVPTLLLLSLPRSERLALLVVAGYAAIYTLAVPALARDRLDRARHAFVACDAVAAGIVILIGGFDSPFYLVLFTIAVSTAMRVALRPALLVVAFFVALDVVSALVQGTFEPGPWFFRSTFLGLAAILSTALYRYAKRGEVELRRVNAQLTAANDKLVKLDVMKSNFISNVSHELRTPLTSIRAFSELGLTATDNPVVTREFFGIINAESERLTRLVGDVLDIMRIESGRIDWRVEPIDLGALVAEAEAIYRPLIVQKGLSFRVDVAPGLPPVAADRDRLRQVLGNLIGNAAKFTARGQIAVRVAVKEADVHVAVSDSGIGIDAADHERIFERFQQAGALLTDKPSGSGLGLSICREIVQYLGGRLWVESRPGVGSTFTFALPVAAERAAAADRRDRLLPA